MGWCFHPESPGFRRGLFINRQATPRKPRAEARGHRVHAASPVTSLVWLTLLGLLNEPEILVVARLNDLVFASFVGRHPR